MLVLLTLLVGVAYPLAITGVSAVAMPWHANGSLVDVPARRVDSVDDAVGSAQLASSSTMTGCSSRAPRPPATATTR